ncbi:heterochromatin protein 1-binding protein 3 isoform X1 [Biomphalaria glabrata]|nr:heterochromatin protein 1-binding protein 3 isoform X1 [Biomphalaria glabrata]
MQDSGQPPSIFIYNKAMPAIKKKWIKASQDGGEVPDELDGEEAVGDEDKETAEGANTAETAVKIKKPKKRSAPTSPSLLRGLDGEVLLEKRKRFIPPAEQKLLDWLDTNLEARTEDTIHLPHLYAYFTDLCQADGSDILDLQQFSRMVKEKFGKTFGVKATSIYKSLIKERKINREKKKSGGIKMKEIVHEAINHFGNPWAGVRMFALKQYIGSKYPALQIDLKPKLLKRSLEMGVQYNQIELVKGIGMAGYYRLPGAKPPSPTKATEPKAAEGEEKEKETDESAEEGAKESATEDQAPKSTEENGEKHEESGEDSKKKKHKPKKIEKVTYSHIRHGNPEKIEDTFPLAITYQSAPKAASTVRIRKYIQEKYGEAVPDHKWRKAIESGVDKGYWEYLSGSGIGGKLHLLMDDFNPGSEQIEDRICAAIIACHEPKAASANQIKKYISKYHPDFKVDERPILYKKALQRALSKNLLTQLSGLGASGSFQLTAPFVPSPLVLAGEDDSEGEADGYESDEPVYIPKGTKSRGLPKIKTVELKQSASKAKAKPKKPAATSSGRSKGRKPVYAEESDVSDEEPEVKKKKSPSKPKPNKKAAAKAKGKKAPASSASSDEEEEEPEYTPKKSQSRGGTAPTSNIKNGQQKGKQPAPASKGNKSVSKSPDVKSKVEEKNTKPVSKLNGETPSKKKSNKNTSSKSSSNTRKSLDKNEVKDEMASDIEQSKNQKSSNKQTDEPPSKRKAKSNSSNKNSSKKAKADVSEEEEDAIESNDEEPEYTPRKSKSRGGTASESKKGTVKSNSREVPSDYEVKEQESSVKAKSGDEVSSGKKKGKGARGRK